MKEVDVCNSCIIKTGGCCTNANLIIHESEIAPFLKAQLEGRISENHSLDKLSEFDNLYFYQTHGNRCLFLSTENKCTIYEKRPTVCRMYPIVWKKGVIESFNIFADLLCPLTHSTPLKNLYHLVKDIKNQNMMKLLGPLIFDDNDNSYLNITDKKNSSDALHDVYEEEED